MLKKINLAVLLIGIVFSSCSTKFSLIKRKYNKGYYLQSTSNKKENKIHAPAPALTISTAETTGRQNTQTEVLPADAPDGPRIAKAPVQGQAATAQKTRVKDAKTQLPESEPLAGKSNPEERGPARPANARKALGSAQKSTPPLMMGSGDMMSAFMYGFGGVIVAILIWVFIYALIFILLSSPELFLLLMAVLVIALVVVGILFIINAD